MIESLYKEIQKMTGKTHLVVGTASALLVTQPSTIKEFFLCIGVAQIGSIISDIDVSTSESRKNMNRIIKLVVVIVGILLFLEYQWKIEIIGFINEDRNLVRILLGLMAFLGVCIFGKEQPHRSFMHSFLAVILLSGILWIIYPIIVPYFAIAMLSHIAIDLLNKKKVKILYPFKQGISFDLCYANGFVNHMLFGAGSIIIVADIIYIIAQMGIQWIS